MWLPQLKVGMLNTDINMTEVKVGMLNTDIDLKCRWVSKTEINFWIPVNNILYKDMFCIPTYMVI